MLNKIPGFFEQILVENYGEEVKNKILEGYKEKRAVTLRANTLKSSIEKIKSELEKEEIIFEEILWNKNALVLENVEEEKIRELEIYKNGEVYLQSLSSMIPPIILNPKPNENILDMAAAPGGKTTQMAAMAQNEAMITACEKNKIRAERLRYNLEKQGATRVNVMMQDARKLDEFFSFDKILLDSPCSGSGTMSVCEGNFTEELIERSIKVQKELLKKAIKILKKGGEMVYSTCSILKGENEEVLMESFKKENIEIIPINEELKDIPQIPVTMEGTICVMPNKFYEGFFIAKIRKK